MILNQRRLYGLLFIVLIIGGFLLFQMLSQNQPSPSVSTVAIGTTTNPPCVQLTAPCDCPQLSCPDIPECPPAPNCAEATQPNPIRNASDGNVSQLVSLVPSNDTAPSKNVTLAPPPMNATDASTPAPSPATTTHATATPRPLPKPYPRPSNTEPFARAIITYLGSGKLVFGTAAPGSAEPDPITQQSTLALNSFQLFLFGNYYNSWKRILKGLPDAWRLDFVVTIDITIADESTRNVIFRDMGCVKTKRTNKSAPSQCVVFEAYKSVLPIETLKEFRFHSYRHYAESLASFMSPDVDLTAYDWLLRSDLDSILTPPFATWVPEYPIVGYDPYHTEFTLHRFHSVAKNLGLNHQEDETPFIANIGPSWYGPRAMIMDCLNLSTQMVIYLTKHEFDTFQKSVDIGLRGWMDWHFGVLSMYAGHIAVNHYQPVYNIIQNHTNLDWSMAEQDPLDGGHYLLTAHGWQSFAGFSKNSLRSGFKEIDLATYELGANTCVKYAIFIGETTRRTYFPNITYFD